MKHSDPGRGVRGVLALGVWLVACAASAQVSGDGGGPGPASAQPAPRADAGASTSVPRPGDGGLTQPFVRLDRLGAATPLRTSTGPRAARAARPAGASAAPPGSTGPLASGSDLAAGPEGDGKHRRFAKKAKHAFDQVRNQEAATLRRIRRVEAALQRGDVSGAMAELGRAKESSEAARETAEELAEAEVLEVSDYVLRSLLSAGIAVLALLLAVVLALLLRRLLSRDAGDGVRAMTLPMRWSYRLIVVVVTLVMLSVGSWVAVRYVWGLRVTGRQVLDVLEHPLFAFEGRPVTFLSVVFFLITLAVLVIVSRNIRGFLERRVMPRFSDDVGVQHAFAAILHYLIVAVGLLVSLEVLGVGASTVAIVAGVVGLGFGFGMQHIINNFLSGLVLFFERPIRVGDVVDVSSGGAGGTEGKVVRIQARATTLLTRDGVTVVVPNSEFVQGRVHNLTIPDNRMRTRIRVGVAYESDLDAVRDILLSVVSSGEHVLAEPPPRVRLVEFADSAVNLDVLFWIDDIMSRDQIQSDLRFEVFRRFRVAGVTFPFPQRDTNLRLAPEVLQAWRREPPEDPEESVRG